MPVDIFIEQGWQPGAAQIKELRKGTSERHEVGGAASKGQPDMEPELNLTISEEMTTANLPGASKYSNRNGYCRHGQWEMVCKSGKGKYHRENVEDHLLR